MRKSILAFGVLMFSGVLGASGAYALTVQAVASNSGASAGNNAEADVLVLVTDTASGAPVTSLSKSDFAVIDHFGLPGQTCGFSNHISSFGNVGTGAYHITVTLDGCKWVQGNYLGQVIVNSSAGTGQATFSLSVP